MKTVRVTWIGASGREWSEEYTDMDLFSWKVNNCVMNQVPFTVDYL